MQSVSSPPLKIMTIYKSENLVHLVNDTNVNLIALMQTSENEFDYSNNCIEYLQTISNTSGKNGSTIINVFKCAFTVKQMELKFQLKDLHIDTYNHESIEMSC